SSLGAARAAAAGVDAIVLGPVFPTRSSAGRRVLGPFRASQIARAAGVPVVALGGINAQTGAHLIGRGFAGIAAVDALAEASWRHDDSLRPPARGSSLVVVWPRAASGSCTLTSPPRRTRGVNW